MARRNNKNGNGRRLVTQQSVDQAVKSICNIMRRGNCAGALQYVPELTWILFLRILDEREEREQEHAEAVGVPFRPSLETPTAGGTGPLRLKHCRKVQRINGPILRRPRRTRFSAS